MDMSYEDAILSAMNGRVDLTVANAMRREHRSSIAMGQEDHVVEVKINLAVALLQLGNQAPGIESYSRCLLYTSPSPRDRQKSRMPSSA